MESKFDNPPKQTNSMKTKKSIFFSFSSVMFLRGAECERKSSDHPPKQSPLQSNEQFKVETSEVIDTTDKNS
jgi:hypothetical protein